MVKFDGNKYLRILRQAIQARAAERDLGERIQGLWHGEIDAELFRDISALVKAKSRAARQSEICNQIAQACREWIDATGASPSYDYPAPQPADDIERAYDDLERIAAQQCALIRQRREILEQLDSDMRTLAIREEEVITALEAAGELPTRLPSAEPEIVLAAK